jgi:hypothetical protein
MLQNESIATAGRAYGEGTRLHIPRILLSASAEFQAAYGQEPPGELQMQNICKSDPRVLDSPWYRRSLKTPPPEQKMGESRSPTTQNHPSYI